MKRVLVTGASGFIGRHCLPALASLGYDVYAISHSRSRPDELATWYSADLLDLAAMIRLLREIRPTHLMHLAWYAEPTDYRDSSENLAWVRASIELVRGFAVLGGRRAVMAGTCFEYDQRYGYCAEGLTPEAPSTLYAVCKNSLRQIFLKYAADAGVSAAWTRIFHLYGPFEARVRLVPSVILSLIGEGRAGCTHGRQLRDVLYVEDVASALAAVLDNAADGVINIGSGQQISICAIVETIARQLHAAGRVDFGARETASTDAPMTVADIGRLREEVGWRPRWPLEEGVAKTIAWWKAAARRRDPAKA
jgi:nucleoside-diphosphate-sugar epimerase